MHEVEGEAGDGEVLKLGRRVVARPCLFSMCQDQDHSKISFKGNRNFFLTNFNESFVFFSKVCNKSTEFLHDKYHSLFHTFEVRHSLRQATTVLETKGHELEHVLII